MSKTFYLTLIFVSTILIHSCTFEKEPAPDNCSDPPEIILVNMANANCNQSNGTVTLSATGGTAPLIYSINGSPAQSSPRFENIGAGIYAASVLDVNGCTSSLEFSILNTDGINLDYSTVGTVCGENQGSIIVMASGAIGDVSYQLNEGNFQTDNQFSNLAQGGYTLTVRDETGCEVKQEVDIKTNVMFADVALIIQSDCTTGGCHDGAQTPDYRGMSNVIGSAELIRQRVANRTMPPSGITITQGQIDTILCWVDDGAKGN